MDCPPAHIHAQARFDEPLVIVLLLLEPGDGPLARAFRLGFEDVGIFLGDRVPQVRLDPRAELVQAGQSACGLVLRRRNRASPLAGVIVQRGICGLAVCTDLSLQIRQFLLAVLGPPGGLVQPEPGDLVLARHFGKGLHVLLGQGRHELRIAHIE